MYPRYIFAIVFVVLFVNIISAQECDYIDSLYVKFLTGQSWKTKYLNGCFDDANFVSTPPEQFYITCTRKNPLGKLEKNAVRNMHQLNKIQIFDCKIDIIESGALSNLSKLIDIRITNGLLTEISKGVFDVVPELRKIYLKRHKISYIEDGAFGNLPWLIELSLSHNQLDSLKKQWFTNSTNIELIDVSHNVIRQIQPKVFETIGKLRNLDLSFNEISILLPKALEGIENLRKLDLRHNKLTSISSNILSKPLRISELRLNGNLFNYFTQDFMDIVKVNYFFMLGNPFKCGCLDRIYWILQEKGTKADPPEAEDPESCKRSDVATCGLPLSLGGTCIETKDEELTKRFLRSLKKIEDRVPEGCARLDYV